MFSSSQCQSTIQYATIPFPEPIKLPYADIHGADQSGPTVVISAGMDGDEYAGIDAAYQMTEVYKNTPISGRIIILPTVNMAGFANHTGWSPIDHIYPKHVFPGKKNGTHTEKLIRWIYNTYIAQADMWIDLHGGSLVEDMQSFLWMYQSKKPTVKIQQQDIIKNTTCPAVVYDRHPFMLYSHFLDSQKKTHILIECGGLGKREAQDIRNICRWTDEILTTVGLIKSSYKSSVSKPNVFTSVHFVYAPSDGRWEPYISYDSALGVLQPENTLHRSEITAKKGYLLWRHIGTSCRKGDVLAAYAAT